LTDETSPDYRVTRSAIEAVWRIEAPRLIAALTRITGDMGAAEELAQDALVIALEQWPVRGVPDGPGAWLMATAKHRAIDLIRRRTRYERKLQEVGRDMQTQQETYGEPDADAMDDSIGDDLLRLIFIACHPVLPAEARAALTLRVIGGLTTHEIARAFLVPEPTIAQRIVRAKRILADKKIPFEIPAPGELTSRLASVLEVIYLIFNEGYAATSGSDWVRPQLCAEAMRLGRVLAGLMPAQIEVHGLVALMELQASRIPARTGPGGEAVLLADQDRRRWDRLLIRRGLAALNRAEQLDLAPGPYAVQAEIAACHARAASVEKTDWERVAALYTVLAHLTPSPVVELNRAVAVGRAYGPARGLEIADRLAGERSLTRYAQFPAVRADLLARLGRAEEARAEFAKAAALTKNERERALFQARAEECAAQLRRDPGRLNLAAARTAGHRMRQAASAGWPGSCGHRRAAARTGLPRHAAGPRAGRHGRRRRRRSAAAGWRAGCAGRSRGARGRLPRARRSPW
jgi:RNA polymerase sigma factor (sigma-70 family)